MRHPHTLRRGLGALTALAASLGSAGCTHNYYYGGVPVAAACPPGTSVAVAENGAICEVPTQVVGGSVVAGTPVVTTPALGGPRPPRVVLSQPNGSSRLGWRTPDPDGGLATTRVEGAIDDPTLTR